MTVTKIKKWGNSLGVRIPKTIAEDLSFEDGAEIEIFIKGELLILRSSKKSTHNLKSLLSRITAKNLHKEIDTDKPVGRETW